MGPINPSRQAIVMTCLPPMIHATRKLLARDYKLPWAILLVCFLFLSVLFLNGCASSGYEEDADETKTWTVEKLYSEAKRELEGGDYESSVKHYETLQARFPFGKYAQQAQLEAAYAYYLYDEHDSAISTATRFIRLHPKHPQVDYAYYIRGLASFHKKDTPLDGIAPQDPSTRDPTTTRESFSYFAELVEKFPTSKYVPDAIKRMKYQRNSLAKHEVNIANYYLQRGAYVAAANRAKYVLQNYPRTPSVPNALLVMAKAYEALNLTDLAKDSKRVLETNYPNFEANQNAAPTSAVQ